MIADMWSVQDAENLRAMLRTEAMQKVLVMVREEAAKMDGLLAADLGSPSGVMAAIKVQGTVVGLLRVLDMLEELSDEKLVRAFKRG